MDEKTEELRDIFVSVSGEETVTERQEESPGSLAAGDDPTDHLVDVITRMRDHHEFDTSLSDQDLATLVQQFYSGDGDSRIADDLDVSRQTVFRARLDLHLVRDRDTEAPFDLDRLRTLLDDDALGTGDIATRLDVSPSTVRRYRRVVRAQNGARSVSDRFRSEFEDVLAEADLSGQFTADIDDDGLDEATDGMETDVSF